MQLAALVKTQLRNAVLNVLRTARLLCLERIALPPISAGIFHYPLADAAAVIFDAIADYYLFMLGTPLADLDAADVASGLATTRLIDRRGNCTRPLTPSSVTLVAYHAVAAEVTAISDAYAALEAADAARRAALGVPVGQTYSIAPPSTTSLPPPTSTPPPPTSTWLSSLSSSSSSSSSTTPPPPPPPPPSSSPLPPATTTAASDAMTTPASATPTSLQLSTTTRLLPSTTTTTISDSLSASAANGGSTQVPVQFVLRQCVLTHVPTNTQTHKNTHTHTLARARLALDLWCGAVCMLGVDALRRPAVRVRMPVGNIMRVALS